MLVALLEVLHNGSPLILHKLIPVVWPLYEGIKQASPFVLADHVNIDCMALCLLQELSGLHIVKSDRILHLQLTSNVDQLSEGLLGVLAKMLLPETQPVLKRDTLVAHNCVE